MESDASPSQTPCSNTTISSSLQKPRTSKLREIVEERSKKMLTYSNDHHHGFEAENHSMSMVAEDHIFKDEHSYNMGSTHTMKPADVCLPKQSYSQDHGHAYTGYNNHDHNGNMMQFSSEVSCEKESIKNDHFGHGGNSHFPHKGGMNHGGYGYGHHKEEMKLSHGGYGGHHVEEMKMSHGGGYGGHQGQYGHHKEEMKMSHGGYGGHHVEGMKMSQGMKMSHGGPYGGHQGEYGVHVEGMKMSHGGYGDHHYPQKKASKWAFKSIVD